MGLLVKGGIEAEFFSRVLLIPSCYRIQMCSFVLSPTGGVQNNLAFSCPPGNSGLSASSTGELLPVGSTPLACH